MSLLCADDVGAVSKSAVDPPKVISVLVTVFEAGDLNVSEKKRDDRVGSEGCPYDLAGSCLHQKDSNSSRIFKTCEYNIRVRP